ncbi:hypothetical protein HK101_011828 [Irineochytrium annulatum]|nr:hypothetical protein HK101_011828 [Irineochytrium annulatum]
MEKTCGFQDMVENVDLASETGEVVDLVSKPREYAKRYLEPRTNYILVKVIGEETEETSPTYVSLLDQVGDKIKFAVLNPTQRQRSKAKTGAREPARGFLGSDDAKDPQAKDTAATRKSNLSSKIASKQGGSGAPSMDELHKEGKEEKRKGKTTAGNNSGSTEKRATGSAAPKDGSKKKSSKS